MSLKNEKIDPTLLHKIVDELILPFLDSKFCSECNESQLEDSADLEKRKKNIIRLSIALMMGDEDRFNLFLEKAISAIKDTHYDKEAIKNELEKFLEFSCKRLVESSDAGEEILKERLGVVCQRYSEKLGIELSLDSIINSCLESDFIDLDTSVERNSFIDNMHYKDEEKKDAETFMKESNIDEDLILDMNETLKYLDEVINFNIMLSESYIESYKEALYKLVAIFGYLYEFKDLELAIESLIEYLNGLDIENIDENNSKIIKSLLDSIKYDLTRWVDEVLISRSAKDIHYLDAALLANIEQIESMFSPNEGDDIELF
jgi:hypothetical protein